jgi:uncharacterized protein (DUF1330 family)
MLYLVAGQTPNSSIVLDPRRILAQGEMAVFEGPWALGASLIVGVDDAAIEYIGWSAKTLKLAGYAVEAQVDPGAGEAFVIGAHRMRDPEGFRPYAEQVAAVVQSFGGRFLARGGKVTPIGGDFVPDRAVIIEFPTATDAVAFYCSDAYAPLLKIRHATADPCFVLMARSGALPRAALAVAENYLRSRDGSSH